MTWEEMCPELRDRVRLELKKKLESRGVSVEDSYFLSLESGDILIYVPVNFDIPSMRSFATATMTAAAIQRILDRSETLKQAQVLYRMKE